MSFECDDTENNLFNREGNMLISDQFNNRVIEIDETGRIVWQYGLGPNDFTDKSIIGPNDAQRIDDMTLMVGTGTPSGLILESKDGVVDNRVILVNHERKIIWQYGQFGLTGSSCNLLNVPVHASFIPCTACKEKSMKCGSVLITEKGGNRVIRVNGKREIIWQYPGTNIVMQDQLNRPGSAYRLDNGHYLIADGENKRAIEVDRHDKMIKVFTASGTLGNCSHAIRLDNGNTLLTDEGKNRVVEVDRHDVIVWQYITNGSAMSINSPSPSRAYRLDNGDTVISNQYNNQIIVVNRSSVIVDVYGLPLTGMIQPGTTSIQTNKGYNIMTTQLGLYAPYDAKLISSDCRQHRKRKD